MQANGDVQEHTDEWAEKGEQVQGRTLDENSTRRKHIYVINLS